MGTRQTPNAVPAVKIQLATDPLRLTLFLLTIITVSRVHQHYAFIAQLRPGLLLVAAATIYAFLHPGLLARGSMLRTWPARVVAIFGMLACLSGVFGISLGNSYRFILEDYSKTLVYAFLLIGAMRNAQDVYSIALGYVLSCGILVYFSQFVFGLSKHANSHVARLSNLYTYDSNDLGLVLLVGLALTLVVLPFTRGVLRWLLVANMLGIAATIARSGSRGAFIGLVGFGIGLLLLARTVSIGRRLLLVVIAAGGLVVGAPPGYWTQMRTVFAPKDDYNFSSKDGRKQLALRGIGYMVAYPVFGLGINNFTKAECTISEKARQHTLNTALRCTPPHNSYIQTASELGVPGIVAWCSLLFGGVAGMVRMRRRLPSQWARGDEEERFLYGATGYIALALVSFSVTSFFLQFAWLDPVYILAALMAGMYAAVDDKRLRDAAGGPAARAPARRQGRGGLSLSGLSIVARRTGA